MDEIKKDIIDMIDSIDNITILIWLQKFIREGITKTWKR